MTLDSVAGGEEGQVLAVILALVAMGSVREEKCNRLHPLEIWEEGLKKLAMFSDISASVTDG
jgi:hypothetical protein